MLTTGAVVCVGAVGQHVPPPWSAHEGPAARVTGGSAVTGAYPKEDDETSRSHPLN